MAWEIETEKVHLDEMVHRTVYVDRSIVTADGKPVRHVDDILLGADGPSATRGLGSGGFTLQDDGKLLDGEGAHFDPRARQRDLLDRLNGFHKAAKAYAQRHGVRIHQPALTGKNGH